MFTTYYETGSLRAGTLAHHRKEFASRKAAEQHAAELSLTSGGYVGVVSKGIEISSFYKGKAVAW